MSADEIDSLFDQAVDRDAEALARRAADGQLLTQREREYLVAERDRRKNARESVLVLQGERGGGKLAGCTQAELAERWGYSVRAIKDWVRRGKDVNDPCPIDRPGEMPAWFERAHPGRRCPGRLAEAAERLEAGPELQISPAPPVAERIEIDESEKGLLATLNRARENEATLYVKYQAAVDAADENRATFLRKEWSTAAENLRSLEKTAPKTLEEIGIYVRKSEVQRELGALHGAVIKTFLQAIRNARLRLRAAASQREWNAIAEELVGEAREMLCNGEFTEPLDVEAV